MKKVFTTFFLLLTMVLLYAKPVSQEEARLVAENFYKSRAQISLTDLKVSDVFIHEYEGQTSFYVFTFNKGGFVMVSADDCASPILGYSLTGYVTKNIENPSTAWYFNNFKKQIHQLKKLKSVSSEISTLWDNYKNGKIAKAKKAAGPLLFTTWDQGAFYNALCPVAVGGPGNRAWAGCVATAMSQIMNYHEWPVTGNGWRRYIPSKHPNYGEQYADFGSTTYDWNNMPNQLGVGSSQTQKTAVSTLIYHAGVAVDMDYDPDGSGASSADVLAVLTSYFKYDPTTIRMYGLGNDTTGWLNIIKNEIDNARPVYYSGGSEGDGGHAWVCDGYDDDNMLHMNWGWSGNSDGYFAVADLDNAGGYNFSEYNNIIVGIQPGSDNQTMLWTKQASAFTTASRGIQYITAVDDRTAWAVGYDGSSATVKAKVKDYTRTTDGGANWKSGTISVSGVSLTNYSAAMVSAIDGNTAWVALFGPNGGGKIVKTSNGGTTWTNQATATFAAPDGFPNVVHFWDENNGFCMGDPNGGYFEIYTTTNGGDNWNRVASNKIPAKYNEEYGTVGYYSVYGDIVWFATNKGRIFKSTDKGYNWTAYQTPITDASFELSFKNETTGIIQRRGDGENNVQYISTDGGQNWTALNPTGNFYTSSFTYVPNSDMLVSTGSDYDTPFMGVSFSTDNGSTFTDYAEFYKNHQFTALAASSENAIWAGGFNTDRYSDGMWRFGDILFAAKFSSNKTAVQQNDSSVVFTDYSYGSPDSWTWDFGDGASPQTMSEAGPHTVKYTTTGYKHVTLTLGKDADQHVLIIKNMINVTPATGIDEFGAESNFKVYPNPSNGVFYMIKDNISTSFEVEVRDMNGKLVYSKKHKSTEKSIDLSDYSSGVYLMKIKAGNEVINKKLIIQ